MTGKAEKTEAVGKADPRDLRHAGRRDGLKQPEGRGSSSKTFRQRHWVTALISALTLGTVTLRQEGTQESGEMLP